MSNSYVAAEMVEIGKGKDVIRGGGKGLFLDDGPGQPRRSPEMPDDE